MSRYDKIHAAILGATVGVFVGSLPWLKLWAIPLAYVTYGLLIVGVGLFFAVQRAICPKPTTED